MRRALGKIGLGVLFAMSLLVLAHMVVTLAQLGWAIFFIPPGTLVRHIEWSDVSRLMWLFVALVVVILLVTSSRWLEPGIPLARHWVAGALMIAIALQTCGASMGIADPALSADEAVRRMGIGEAELAALPPCEQVRWLVRLSPYVNPYAGRPLIGG